MTAARWRTRFFLPVASIHFIIYYGNVNAINPDICAHLEIEFTINRNPGLYFTIITKCKDATQPIGEVVCVKR